MLRNAQEELNNIMSFYTFLNVFTNCTTAISSIALLIHVFGDPDNPIWDNKIKAWLAKIGLALTICGAISNAINLVTPPPTQALLDCGISFTFCWLSWWQWEQFRDKMEADKKKARKKKPLTAVKQASIVVDIPIKKTTKNARKSTRSKSV